MRTLQVSFGNLLYILYCNNLRLFRFFFKHLSLAHFLSFFLCISKCRVISLCSAIFMSLLSSIYNDSDLFSHHPQTKKENQSVRTVCECCFKHTANEEQTKQNKTKINIVGYSLYRAYSLRIHFYFYWLF